MIRANIFSNKPCVQLKRNLVKRALLVLTEDKITVSLVFSHLIGLHIHHSLILKTALCYAIKISFYMCIFSSYVQTFMAQQYCPLHLRTNLSTLHLNIHVVRVLMTYVLK